MRRICRAFAAVAERHGALLYVDDAHGFGVIGERGADETSPYGMRGNCVVRHFGESYDNLILVSGFSKAYSSLLAFVACPTDVKELLKVAAPPYLYSGPSPVASLATVLKGFDVNEQRGDALRAVIWKHSARVVQRLGSSGSRPRTIPSCRSSRCRSASTAGSPPSASACSIAASTSRWRHTRSYPRPRSASASSSTAANTDTELDTLLAAIEELAVDGELMAADELDRGPEARAA